MKSFFFVQTLNSGPRQEPLAGEGVDAEGIFGSGCELVYGVEEALIVFYANVLAVLDSRLCVGADVRRACDGVAGDVESATFCRQELAEAAVARAKIFHWG